MGLRRVLFTVAVLGVTCDLAVAGDLKCHVTRAGADEAGVSVKLEPGGAAVNTRAGGNCEFTDLRGGPYRVTGEKVIGGTLYGAVADGVAAPLRRGASVTLELTRAIHLNRYLPLHMDDFWQYHFVRHTSGLIPVTTTGTRTDRVVGTDTIAEETVSVINATALPTGPIGRKDYRKTSSEGHAVFRQESAADTVQFDPPMRFANLWPLGHCVHISTTLKHSDGTPDERLEWAVTFVAFEDVTVPAGPFRQCARIEYRQELDGRPVRRGRTKTVWLARDVGEVCEYQEFGGGSSKSRRELEEYKVTEFSPRPPKPPGTIRPPVMR